MILIYTHKHSQALRQMCDYISQIIGINFHIAECQDPSETKEYSHVIQYLNKPNHQIPGYWIPNSGYLDNRRIPISIGSVTFPKNKILDDCAHELANLLKINPNPYPKHLTHSVRYTYFPIESDFGFDLFAHLYVLLMNIEESQANSRDSYGRVPSSNLLMVQSGMHLLPMADIAVQYFCGKLNLLFTKKPFKIIPTADVDQCYRFKEKSLVTLIGGALLHPSTFLDRLKYCFRKRDDFTPYDTLGALLSQNPDSRIFWLHPKKTKLSIESEIVLSKDYAQVGLHPDLLKKKSSDIYQQWTSELSYLENLTSIPIKHSRQHYISIKLPETYTLLNKLGITDDWSMGFFDTVGFRAGTASNYVYSISNSENINVHPFQIMDVSCRFYLKLKSNQANYLGILFKRIIKENGGDFCFIVHNESLSQKQGWKSWFSTFLSWSEYN